MRRRTASADASRTTGGRRSAERPRLDAQRNRGTPSPPSGSRAGQRPGKSRPIADRQRSRPCRCWNTRQGLDPTNPCDRGQTMNQGTSGPAVREMNPPCSAESAIEAADWPPAEQDDTSDELHEHAWWQQAADISTPSSAEVTQALDVF